MHQGLRRWFGGKDSPKPSGGDGPRAAAAATSTPPPAPTADTNARATPPDEQQLTQRFARTLEERCGVLMRVASAETRKTDAPLIIESLQRLDETVIRQPPIAAQRALAVARNPMSSTDQLAEIFQQDPALTEALLRIANSSYYFRGDEPCVSIPEAIQRVGYRGIESIVTTSMVEGLLCRPGNTYAPLLTLVWSHMTRTAPIARALAPGFKAAPETAFTVGLLHDAGKLMIFDHVSQLRSKHRREINVPERFLLDMLNRLHEPLGALAALRWNLGAAVARSIAWHHHNPPPAEPDLLSELLCVSEQMDHAMRLGTLVDLWGMWREGEHTADPQVVRDLVADMPGIKLADSKGRAATAAKAA